MKDIRGLIITGILGIFSLIVNAQDFPAGFDYQGVLRDNVGLPVTNTDLDIIIGIYSGETSDILIWEENQTSTTNADGYYQLIIGEGTSTGQGLVTDFDAINWNAGNYSINIEIDQGQEFEDFGMNQLYSVPFAYYAKQAENQLYLNNMADVDTSLINTGDILRWTGVNYEVFPYSDTVAWAMNALSADFAQYSDTANYAYNALACPPCDTAIFAFYGDSALWSLFSNTALFSLNAAFADTALVALGSPNAWSINGNENLGSNAFLGSIDSNDVSFSSNGVERMVIKGDGKIGIGLSDPQYDLHLQGNNGVLFSGDFGAETTLVPDTGSATFWIPSKSAFRTGFVNNDAWAMSNIGNYSFSGGYNSKASGDYAFAFGQVSIASGEASTAIGFDSKATKSYAIAMGSQASASGFNSIAMGRAPIASDSMSIAMGYWPNSSGKAAIALGYQCRAEGDYSIAIGYKSRPSHEGAIVLSDRSTNAFTVSTAENQFMVRAAGGTIIYSDAEMTTGVSLAAGSGSWSTLSDSTLKENIELPDVDQIMKKAKALDVYSWNYIAQNDSIRHIGPMAQDFYAAFGFGEDERTISAVDFDGINFLLLKTLIEKEEELSEKINLIEKLSLELEYINFDYDMILERLMALMN